MPSFSRGAGGPPKDFIVAQSNNAAPRWVFHSIEGNFLRPITTAAPAIAAGQANGVSFNPQGNIVLVSPASSTPFLRAYEKNGNSWISLTIPNVVMFIPTWAPDGSMFSCGGTYGNGVINHFVRNENTFTQLTTATVITTPYLQNLQYSPDGKVLVATYGAAVGGVATRAYERSTTNDFTAISSSSWSTLPGIGWGMKWNKDGTSIAFGNNVSPYLRVWNYDKTTKTFTQIPTGNFDILPGGNIIGNIDWNEDGTLLAVGGDNAAPYIHIYARSGDLFKKCPALPSPLTNNSTNLRFSPDGSILASGGYLIASKFWRISGKTTSTFTATLLSVTSGNLSYANFISFSNGTS